MRIEREGLFLMKSLIIGVLVGLVTTSVVADTQLLATDSASSKSGCSECEKCGTVVTPEVIAHIEQMLQDGTWDEGRMHPLDDGVTQYVRITAHVVRDSNGNDGLPQHRIDTAIEDLNAHIEETKLVFCQVGDTNFIDSDQYTFIESEAEANALRKIDVVDGSVNVYFVPSAIFCGISAFSIFGGPQGIVMNNECTATDWDHSTFTHEMGHYFNLFHTHSTYWGVECVNGSNCASAGDMFCDTPADPMIWDLVDSGCGYIGTEPDACGSGAPYMPLTNNIMSYSVASCCTLLTPEQLSMFRWSADNQRADHLTDACGGDVWTVDVNGGGDFTSIQAAVNNAVGGDEIIVAPGVYTSLQGGHVVDMQGKTIWLHSSDGADVTAIDGNNARRGIYCGSGETSNTVIEGFTITNGLSVGFDYNGNGIIDGAEDDGGGVCCYDSSSPTFINCIITNNHGTTGGGGISCRLGCNVALIDCIISDNVDDQAGGGIWCRSSYPTITGCVISNNTSVEPGGGIRITSGTPTLSDSYFCGNYPDQIFGNWSDAGENVIEEVCFFIPTGACCLADSCSVEEEDGCNAVGGVYRGDESSCIDDSCIGDTVWTVDDDGGAEFTSIQDAINASLNGDEVLVSPGTYTGSGNNVIDFLGKSIVLRSSDGSGVTFIDGEGLRRVILCDKGETTSTTIDGFTIRNGSATAYPDWFSMPLHLGGGMLVKDSSPIVSNCIFEDNIATGGNGGYGAAIFTGNYEGNSNLTLTDCYFANNSTDNSGGAVYLYFADCEMTHCTARDNVATNGGGLYVDMGVMTLNNSLICGNTPNQINGPWVDGGNNTVEDICGGVPTGACCVGYDCSIVTEMDCEYQGGGYLGNSSSCIADPCTPPSNTWTVGIDGGTDFDTIQEAVYMAVNGDEIIVMPGTYTSTADNVVDMMGKSIFMRSSNGAAVTIIDGEFERRGIVYGYAEHPISLEGFTIQNCVATPYNWDGSGNYINIGGGLLITDAEIDVSGCIIDNNVAHDGSGYGGGVFVNSQMMRCDVTFTGCTITQNYADRSGGGLHDFKSIVSFVTCTFDQNSSSEGGGGMCLQESDASITNCVISNNIADLVSNSSSGGGLLLLDTIPTLVNTTVCGNNPNQIDGDWIDNGGNIIEIECISICPGDINEDELVNVVDLLIVIDQWGQGHSPADINNDGIVDVSDLLIIVGNWGSCEG